MPLDFEKAGPEEYEKLAAALEQEFGRLDALLHNAGMLGERAPIEHHDVAKWMRTMHVNVTAPFILTRYCLPLLQTLRRPVDRVHFERRRARARARTGARTWSSKWASDGLMRMLADELENQPTIRVNSIDPGKVRTNMRLQAYPAEDPQTLPEPAAIVAPYLFLLGPDSRGVSGADFRLPVARLSGARGAACAVFARRACSLPLAAAPARRAHRALRPDPAAARVPAARQIARQFDVGELHLDHAAHLQPAALEQRTHGSAAMSAPRLDAKPAIRPLAARGLDAFELDRLLVVLHDARQRVDVELGRRHEHARDVGRGIVSARRRSASARRPSLVSSISPLSPACIVLMTSQRAPRTDGSDSITDLPDARVFAGRR